MDLLEILNWRYATKKFNGDLVSSDHIDMITKAIALSPSSIGSQPYHIIVASGALKDRLIESSGQLDKKGCSHLFVFCSRTDYPARADAQIQNTANIQGVSVEALAPFSKMLGSIYTGKTPEQIQAWAARQAYIALGIGLVACAELHIDACPMEGFKPAEFHDILELPDFIQPVVIMAVGHRDIEDATQPEMRPKVRFPLKDLFEFR